MRRSKHLGGVLGFDAKTTDEGWEVIIVHRTPSGGICPTQHEAEDYKSVLKLIDETIKTYGVDR